MTVEEAFKLLMSMGIIQPSDRPLPVPVRPVPMPEPVG
jgi:uncharacterized membrane protein